MAEHKIPAFVANEFRTMPNGDKPEFTSQLANWKSSKLTESLVEYLKLQVEKSYIYEDQSSPSFRFEGEYVSAQERGKRAELRLLIGQLES